MNIDKAELRYFCQLHFCEWNANTMRSAYHAIVHAWKNAGVPPNRLGANAPGIGLDWKTYKYRHKKLERTNFEGVEWFTMSCIIEEGVDASTDWLAHASLQANKWEHSIRLGWTPAMIGTSASAFPVLASELATLGRARYGFCTLRNVLNSSRPWWVSGFPDSVRDALLYGVHAHNYLNNGHLEAPFGRTTLTLRQWIEAAPAERGELRPFTDILIDWAPPIDSIPYLREVLFRSGRLYYDRFFQPYRSRENGLAYSAEAASKTVDKGVLMPEPFYRPNIYEPWETNGPIPEIFQAARYHELFQGMWSEAERRLILRGIVS